MTRDRVLTETLSSQSLVFITRLLIHLILRCTVLLFFSPLRLIFDVALRLKLLSRCT